MLFRKSSTLWVITAVLALVGLKTCEVTALGQRCLHTRYHFLSMADAAVVTTLNGVLDGPARVAPLWDARYAALLARSG